MAKVRMSKGKFIGIDSVADDNGVIAALAIDQRGSLQKAIAKVKGSPAGDDDLRQFKMLISEVLTPYASAILLDPEYGLDAIPLRARQTGVLRGASSGRSAKRISSKPLFPDNRTSRWSSAMAGDSATTGTPTAGQHCRMSSDNAADPARVTPSCRSSRGAPRIVDSSNLLSSCRLHHPRLRIVSLWRFTRERARMPSSAW